MKYFIQKYSLLAIILLLFNTQYLFSQCDVIFPKISMESGDYKSWEESNRSDLNKYYHGISEVGNNQATLTSEAVSSLANTISTTIQSDLRMYYKEDKYDVIINTIEENIIAFSKSTIMDYNKIIVKHPGQGISVHVFKCKDDVENERDEHNKKSLKKINDYKGKYKRHFRDQEYSYGFQDLCNVFVYINSVSDIEIYSDYLEDYIEVKDRLKKFLKNVNIILNNHKNKSTVRAVPLPKSNKIIELTATYEVGKRHPLSDFKIKSEISEVSAWDNNIEEVLFDKRGKAELEIPIIYSGEEAIISFIPFADILHVQTILVNKASTRELETILDNNFTEKQDEVTIKIKKGQLKVQYSDSKYEHFQCDDEGYCPSFKTKIEESFKRYGDKIELENLVGNPKLSIVIRKKNSGGYNFTTRILIDDYELAENSKFLDDGSNITSDFCNSLIQEMYKVATQASIEGKLDKGVSIEINNQKGDSRRVSYDRRREGLFKLALEKDKWKITLLKNRESFKDTIVYLNKSINLSSWFKNGIITPPPPKKVLVNVAINHPRIKHDIVLFWDGKRKDWKSEGEGFGKFIGVEGKKHRLKLKKDGWEVYNEKHTIKKYGHKIDVGMKKIKLNLPRNIGYSVFPGSCQFNWYKTNWKMNLLGIALFSSTVYLINETYKSNRDYTAFKQEYSSTKMIYESLVWADNQTEFDINYQNTLTAYNAMESSYIQRKYNMIGFGSVYLINLVHLLYINYNF